MVFKNFKKQWQFVDTYTRFLAFITLLVSLLITCVVYMALETIQKEAILEDLIFAKDLMHLCLSNIVLSSSDHVGQQNHLSDAIENLYLTIANLKYIILSKGFDTFMLNYPQVVLSPIDSIVEDYCNIRKCADTCYGSQMIVNYRYTSDQQIIHHMIVPVVIDDYQVIYLQLGIMHGISILWASYSIKYISIAIFTSIWLISSCTIFFNFTCIREAISPLNRALNSIASGDFRARLRTRTYGPLHDVMLIFNEMAEKLEYYEKKNIEQLILEKSKLETLVSIMADGAILLDKELRIVFINQSALTAFKFLRSCVTGRHLLNYLPYDISNRLMPLLNYLIESYPSYRPTLDPASFKIRLDKDSSRTFQLVITTVLDPENEVLTGIGIIIQDITNQVGLDEAKAQFISNVSHELRTPLFNIRSFLETLSEYRDSLTEKQQIEFLDIANQETYRLTCLVNDVLDLSRLESDFIDPLDLIEFQEIVITVVQTYQLRANNKYVRLGFMIGSYVYSARGYINLLVQVVSNLVGNSLKFTFIDERINLRVYAVNSYGSDDNNIFCKIRVEVIDEGTGIGEFDQSRIFDRFVRLENNVHTLEGTGLGLSIVKNIINKHKSKICLYSELSVGSSFWFDLPLLEKKH
uniref:Uncharacterized sensor-like histidine kinase ycf26 n=1 Tax=Scinaia undulata TaxID=1884664 RepID=A0A1G4NXE9_9FLOR|nr:Drug sensory protein A [Scinaia undulata]SCW23327.1 Drug sensory protein A [Scinaia undulata]